MANLLYNILSNTNQLVSRAVDENCTIDTCPDDAFWGYRPSIAANAFFAAAFGISTCAYLVQGVLGRKFIGFSIAMVCGCLLEVIGYVGRILAYDDVFAEVSTPLSSLTALPY